MPSLLRAFWNDERGIALILVSIMLPAIVGFALLAIDMSRANNLHNDLQKAADAMAIAGAAELDGKVDAITRADRAVAKLVANQYTFSSAGLAQDLTSAGIDRIFLNSLPASDNISLNPLTGIDGNGINHLTVDPAEARYISVRVRPVGFQAIFPASFLSGNAADNALQIGATAVAGFGSSVCDFTPMFVCNPYELVGGVNNAGGITLQDAAGDRAYRRRLIELRKVGNGAAAGPGNFGFLEPPQGVGNGAQALAETIATSHPVGCYGNNKVTTKTGQNAGPVQDAFNVRFGISANGSHFNSPIYGPAANVRKGALKTQGAANQCPNLNQLTFNLPGTAGFPRDTTWPYMGGRMGSGIWDFVPYWNTNFGAASYPTGWSTDPPSRYELYQYEIANNLVATASTGGEIGTPNASCQPPVTTVDRRVLYVAILNCQALTALGNNLSGHSENLPVEGFGSFFIAEPVPSASEDASVFVELIDVSGGGQGTLAKFLRDDVQLYR